MVNLNDIASRAGVSQSTASRALADSPLVNAETKRRIKNLAEEAGYRVNLVARSLKTRETRTIGLVVPQVINPYFPQLIQSLADRVAAAGYNLQLHLSGQNQESEAVCLGLLRETCADGILLVSGSQGLVARAETKAMMGMGTPIVVLGWIEESETFDVVMGDDAVGGYQLATHLIGLGHRKFAVIGARLHRGPHDRLHGFLRGLQETGVSADHVVQVPASTDQDVERAVARLISSLEAPTAIFAYRDALAAQVLKHLAHAGISVPEQMSVVGFDNLDLATYVSPQLTTIDLPINETATNAVELLISRMQRASEEATPRHIVLTPHLVVRQSSAAPRSDILLWRSNPLQEEPSSETSTDSQIPTAQKD